MWRSFITGCALYMYTLCTDIHCVHGYASQMDVLCKWMHFVIVCALYMDALRTSMCFVHVCTLYSAQGVDFMYATKDLSPTAKISGIHICQRMSGSGYLRLLIWQPP